MEKWALFTVGTDSQGNIQSSVGSVCLENLLFHLPLYLGKNRDTLHLQVNEQNGWGGRGGRAKGWNGTESKSCWTHWVGFIHLVGGGYWNVQHLWKKKILQRQVFQYPALQVNEIKRRETEKGKKKTYRPAEIRILYMISLSSRCSLVKICHA